MEEFATLEKLFANLGARLNQFENKSYLIDKFHSNLPAHERSDYSRLIYKIDNHIYGFNPKEAISFVTFYEKRVSNILKSLERVQQWAISEGPFISIEPIPIKFQEELWEDHNNELNIYLTHFRTYKEILEEQVSMLEDKQPNATPSQTTTSVQLPENFTVKQLAQFFEPKLSLNQAALFLYYLREETILPPYSDSSIGILAEAFFARNKKGITEGLTDIYTIKQNSNDLNILKRVLEKLLEKIESDLNKAR